MTNILIARPQKKPTGISALPCTEPAKAACSKTSVERELCDNTTQLDNMKVTPNNALQII